VDAREACKLLLLLLCSVMSRIALAANTPSSVCSGLKLICAVELRPILAQSAQLEVGTHGVRRPAFEEPLPVSQMLAATPLGKQHLDLLAKQLAVRVSEQLFRLRVDQNDADRSD
jgi:hypothetical protein